MFKIIDMLTGTSSDTKPAKSMSRKNSKQKSIKKKKMVEASSENSFWINQGAVIGNLVGLSDALGAISDDTFKYHVNKDKNDFALWVKEVLGEGQLAKNLSRIKNRKSYQKVVDKYIKDKY